MLELLETELLIRIVAVLVLAFVIIASAVLYNFRKLTVRYKKFIAKLEETESLDENLENYLYKVQKIENQFAIIRGEMQNMSNEIKSCVKKVAIVKYNAFEDVSNDLSFVIAMLDENENGILLNGIYARETSSIFTKEVIGGKCTMAMSKEEDKALENAKNKKLEKVGK